MWVLLMNTSSRTQLYTLTAQKVLSPKLQESSVFRSKTFLLNAYNIKIKHVFLQLVNMKCSSKTSVWF